MLRVKEGDDSAFAELVRNNTHKVHALVYRFLGGSDQAEDVTQEVFLRIYRTAPKYAPSAKFSTWMYRIVANLCFNVMRYHQRRPVSHLGASDERDAFGRDMPDPAPESPADPMHREELRDRIAEAVAQLPDNQRLAIILNQYENKGYEEISRVLDCSTMAVKSLLSRARENLRQRLRKDLEIE